MQRYTLDNNVRIALAPYHREFQAAVAVIANRTLGVEIENPQGIGKYEGGVVVRNAQGRVSEIAIKSDFVVEDWRRKSETIPEETEVDGISCTGIGRT
jgi:hypothetical protein